MLQEMIPFAVVGSNQEYQVNGRRFLGRKTKWGTIEGTESHAYDLWANVCGHLISLPATVSSLKLLLQRWKQTIV